MRTEIHDYVCVIDDCCKIVTLVYFGGQAKI
jgi:hypothetical protein